MATNFRESCRKIVCVFDVYHIAIIQPNAIAAFFFLVYGDICMSKNTLDDYGDGAYVATATLALLLDVSREKLDMDRFRGTGLPYTKIGKSVRYKIADVRAMLDAGRVEVTE